MASKAKRPVQKLSRSEVNALCAEFFALREKMPKGGLLSYKFKMTIYHVGWDTSNTFEPSPESKADNVVHVALKKRMGEIIRLVGQDTLDEYEERQDLEKSVGKLEKAVEELEDKLSNVKDNLVTLGIVGAAAFISAICFTLLV